MEEINSLTADTILSDDILIEVFEQEDEIYKARLLLTLTDRAKELGVKTKFETLVKAYNKVKKNYDKDKEIKQAPESFDNYTQFGDEYPALYCGNWFADQTGIRIFAYFGERLACYHPILPIQRLVNVETGKEKIKLAFKKGVTWKEIIVDKGVVASNNKIVSLADYGVSVTSETAKSLVQFLADVENFNVNEISTQISTSKLGWIQKEFMPYGQQVIFDNESRFKVAYDSIQPIGDREVWYQLMKKIRQSNRFEPKIYLAGVLASVLLEPLNALPFVINLWGDTGKGKTVAIMLAASVWANPSNNDYITDPKSTVTALELRLDFLNHLPVLIDDMAQLKERYSGDFSELIYMLCSGKGKDRANQNLAVNKATTWKNVILTNGEHSLITETMQGGAVNRIIDCEMEEGYIFENGNLVVETIKKNYGFCGKDFIGVIQEIGIEAIQQIQTDFLERINQTAKEQEIEKEEKQTLPMSILLTADKIATEYLFQDSIYLDFDSCVKLLKNKGEVSENERAYEFILSEISVNIAKFKPDYRGEYKGEVWGCFEHGYAIILNNAFNRICERGNFSRKSFLSWAVKRNLICKGNNGKNSKTKRIQGTTSRCIYLKLEDATENNEFISISEEEQLKLPFMQSKKKHLNT